MKLFILSFLIFYASCFAQNDSIPTIDTDSKKAVSSLPDEKPKKRKQREKKWSVEQRLKYYFMGREIIPSIIVNNTEPDQTKINLENNVVEWIRGEDEVKIKINDDIFSLANQKTLNDKEDVDFANQWQQVKFYKFGDRQIIGITMGNEPCTGIGCSVAFQLIYDLKTKNKAFFGTYRIDREVNLYDFKNDGTIDYLGKTYVGDSADSAVNIQNIYRLYSMNETGNFQLQSDKNQKPYFMQRFFEAEDYEEIDKKFAANWIEEIR